VEGVKTLGSWQNGWKMRFPGPRLHMQGFLPLAASSGTQNSGMFNFTHGQAPASFHVSLYGRGGGLRLKFKQRLYYLCEDCESVVYTYMVDGRLPWLAHFNATPNPNRQQFASLLSGPRNLLVRPLLQFPCF